jgi:hypothetical protein
MQDAGREMFGCFVAGGRFGPLEYPL